MVEKQIRNPFEGVVDHEQRREVFQREFERIQQGQGTEYKKMRTTVELTRAYILTMPIRMDREPAERMLQTLEHASEVIREYSNQYSNFVSRNFTGEVRNANNVRTPTRYWSQEHIDRANAIRRDVTALCGGTLEQLRTAQDALRDYLGMNEGSRGLAGLAGGSPRPQLTQEQQFRSAIVATEAALDRIQHIEPTAERINGVLQEVDSSRRRTVRWGSAISDTGIRLIGTFLGGPLGEAISAPIGSGTGQVLRNESINPIDILSDTARDQALNNPNLPQLGRFGRFLRSVGDAIGIVEPLIDAMAEELNE